MSDNLNGLMTRFAERHGLNVPEPDAKGRYYLTFDHSLEVVLFQVYDRIYLEGQLEPVPAERIQAEDVLKRCLQTQLTRLREHQEIVSIDLDRGVLLLFRELPTRDLGFSGFERALEGFVNALAFWRCEPGSGASTPPPLPVMSLFFP